jgi:phytoene dehydrogenase-like protein
VWFAEWRGTPWRRRGAEYEALKRALAERLLELAERAVPGLRQLVTYQELCTPLSVEHFTGSPWIYARRARQGASARGS